MKNLMNKQMTVGDMSREIAIHICKDGTISYRNRLKKEKIFNGVALPVFSVDTVEQAREIQIRFGRCQYDEHPQIPGRPWYKWTDFSGEVKDLAEITLKCREFYENFLAKKE